MEKIEKSIEVEVPVSTAYNQWTQFQEFPQFMEGIKRVHQIDDVHLHWVAEIGGKEKEWNAEIVEQIPDKRIAWSSTSGPFVSGVVTFHFINYSVTKVMLQMEYNPEGFVETVGDALGFVSSRVQGDLERFKKFIENRGEETGAWRGKVENPAATSGS